MNHDSFQMLGEIRSTMTNKNQVYAKLKAFASKFSPAFMGILLDSSSISDVSSGGSSSRGGFGYEMASSLVSTRFAQGNDVYPLVFTWSSPVGESSPPTYEPFPASIDSHMKFLVIYLGYDLDQKVKFFYEQVNYLVYYLIINFRRFVIIFCLFLF